MGTNAIAEGMSQHAAESALDVLHVEEQVWNGSEVKLHGVSARCHSVWPSIRSIGFDGIQSLHDYLPDGLRIIERASLAGNVSLSSSSSRWSGKYHSGFSGVSLPAETVFLGAAVLRDRRWFAGRIISEW